MKADNVAQKNSRDFKEILGQFMNKYAIFLVLVLMVIILSIISPTFLRSRNLLNVVRQISMIAIIAMGVTFIIITGGIDLSSGSVVALSGVVAASVVTGGKYPVIVGILVGMAVGSLAGGIAGWIITRQNIPAFISTLGMMISARGAALLYTDGKPVTGFTPGFEYIAGGYILGVPTPIYILAIVTVVSHILLKHTKFGKYVYAIGGNYNAAIVSGINAKNIVLKVYMFAGLLTGLTGVILASRLSAGQPTAAVGYELDAIAAATIGGVSHSGGIGTIPGTIVGALIMGVLNNGLDLMNVSAYWQQIIKGIIIVSAVVMDKKRNR
ncbi:ABC transporter permease [Anaerotalea alkaliphila]|uniref:ABC transporter permease n=1 Tax=Anaerotalea alkaliphila TaxID=2662126 RepID=A0A7X5HY46_9FIRM|nr:ABC transporter permease [Anaerotalea alkaliphila]NDL68755.1 ABC transporter permease [Anaerotalea alkaliphila]